VFFGFNTTKFCKWGNWQVVLLRIPDFRDRNFRIFQPILKKGFESDPDLSDPIGPNAQIPQKRSVIVATIHTELINAPKSTKNCNENFFVPKVAQICEIPGNFGCFLPGNKDSNPCLEDPDFLSPAKKGQRVGSLNPNPWIRNNTNTLFAS
jgi:hypothetical protein